MSPSDAPEEGVLEGLRRRRVIRVVVAYIAICFGALSAGVLLLDHVPAPDWTFRVLLGAAALGFPLTVVLAWTYDVTPTGVVRTPETPPSVPPEAAAPAWTWRAVVAAGLLLTAVSWILRYGLR